MVPGPHAALMKATRPDTSRDIGLTHAGTEVNRLED